MLTAGITSVILFIVIMVHEVYLIAENKPTTLSDILININSSNQFASALPV